MRDLSPLRWDCRGMQTDYGQLRAMLYPLQYNRDMFSHRCHLAPNQSIAGQGYDLHLRRKLTWLGSKCLLTKQCLEGLQPPF